LKKRIKILIVSIIHVEFIRKIIWLGGISFHSWQALLVGAVTSYGIKSAN